MPGLAAVLLMLLVSVPVLHAALASAAAGTGTALATAGDGRWYVRYLLQAAKDPSLLIPAQEAWKARGIQAALLKEAHFNAREYLLLSLGQASGLSSAIEASLKTSSPGWV